MTRTGRTPEEVMHDALAGAAAAGWTGDIGADADHLKTTEDVDITAAAGFTFFTIDPSGHVDQQADDYDESQLRTQFAAVKEFAPWFDDYCGKTYQLPTGTTVDLNELACMRTAVKYGKAIQEAIALGHYIQQVQDDASRPCEIELSVDETDQPTKLAEHFIVASECLKADLRLISLAPRFLGDFEKGVDFKGDQQRLSLSLADHAAIANLLGPYKLSLHSGSDKLSVYAPLANATQGRFHVKTAGTSYLEAIRVVAMQDDALFREVIDFSRQHFERDRATYHVSATLSDTPETGDVDSRQLQDAYLESWSDVPEGAGFTKPGRQILHCTFGSVLTDEKLGPRVKGCINDHPDTYAEVLDDHFGRHLLALQAGMS